MAKAPLAVFRCEASPTIGGGHVMRCIALAQALVSDGWRVAFAVSDVAFATVPALRSFGREVATGLSLGAEQLTELKVRWPDGCDLLVFDHYGWDATLERSLASFSRARLVIDDLVDRPHDAEFVVDQTLMRRVVDYGRLVPTSTTLLTGSDFAILRPEFAQRRHRLPAPGYDSGAKRILVALGMTDPGHGATLAVDAIEASRLFKGQIDVVIGGAAPALPRLRERADTSGGRLAVHSDIDAAAMADLIASADVAIGAAGTSSYERACLGLPTLVVEVAANQRDNIASFEAAGAALALGPLGDLTAAGIADQLDELLADKERLRRMHLAALGIADGCGAQRIALALRPEHCGDATPVGFRCVRADDASLLYEWQSEPETRRFARNPRVPTWEEHIAWINRKLADPGCLFNLVVAGGEPAGFVRLDRVPPIQAAEQAFEVSIAISAKHTGRGLATAALRLARRVVPDAEIQAVVLPENGASLKLFARSGYKSCGGDRYLAPAMPPPPR